VVHPALYCSEGYLIGKDISGHKKDTDDTHPCQWPWESLTPR